MRIILALASIALITAACAKRPIQLQTPCAEKPTSEIIGALSALVAAEGFDITLMNENAGILQAQSGEQYNAWIGATVQNKWSFVVRAGRVEAYAKSVTVTKNAFGGSTGAAETYYDDAVHEDHKWYWNVRHGLEHLCGSQVTFIQQ